MRLFTPSLLFVSRLFYHTSSGQRFVDWTIVDALVRFLSVRCRFQPDNRHIGVQLLRSGLGQLVVVVIPSGTFEEKTPDETAVGGTRGQVCFGFLHHLSKIMVYVNFVMIKLFVTCVAGGFCKVFRLG